MSAPPLLTADLAEKGIIEPLNDSPGPVEKGSHESISHPPSFLHVLNAKVLSISFLEERGIQRVPEDERYHPSTMGYVQMALLWFSINLTANNIALGLLGPLVYGLGFTDSALCATFGGLLGSAGAAYMSKRSPISCCSETNR